MADPLTPEGVAAIRTIWDLPIETFEGQTWPTGSAAITIQGLLATIDAERAWRATAERVIAAARQARLWGDFKANFELGAALAEHDAANPATPSPDGPTTATAHATEDAP